MLLAVSSLLAIGLLCGSLPSMMNAEFGAGSVGSWLLSVGWLVCCGSLPSLMNAEFGADSVGSWLLAVVSVFCVIVVLFYRFGAKISASRVRSKEIAQMFINS